MSVKDLIDDKIYTFQRLNHYYPSILNISSDLLESLIREIDEENLLVPNGTYLKMTIKSHHGFDTLYLL